MQSSHFPCFEDHLVTYESRRQYTHGVKSNLSPPDFGIASLGVCRLSEFSSQNYMSRLQLGSHGEDQHPNHPLNSRRDLSQFNVRSGGGKTTLKVEN